MMMTKILKCYIAFALILPLAGCSSLPSLPPPTATEPLPDQISPSAAPVQEAYKLGPEDELQITVYEHDDLSRTLVLDPNGAFDFPLIGKIEAVGMTVGELEKELRTRLGRDYLVNPQIAVVVTKYRNRQVYVLGEVRNPGVYPLNYNETLFEVISSSGGLTDAAGSYAVLIRSANGAATGTDQASAQKIIHIDLDQLLTGKMQRPIPLQNGDTIRVLPGDFVFISGQVQNPGRYALERDATVERVVILAGGFTQFAAKKRLRVRRLIDGEPQEFSATLHDRLQNNDVVIVPESVL